MTSMGVTRLRDSIPEVVERVRYEGERIVVERHGKPVIAIVSVEDLNLLRKVEDMLDILEADEAEAEPGPDIPLDEMKRRLGLA
jgi:prevent-host-death family protein